jgi:hypothetical protein
MIACTAPLPKPGKPNTCSVTTAPPEFRVDAELGSPERPQPGARGGS